MVTIEETPEGLSEGHVTGGEPVPAPVIVENAPSALSRARKKVLTEGHAAEFFNQDDAIYEDIRAESDYRAHRD